MSLVRYSVKS